MSDYSIGAYKELCKGIEVSFEAVLAIKTEKSSADPHEGAMLMLNPRDSGPQISFSTKTDKLLEETNARA